MMTKHTPGPWEVSGEQPMLSQLLNGGIKVNAFSGRHNRYLSIFNICHDEAFGAVETTFANAHLVSAAPDLFEALTEMLREYDAWEGYNDDGFESKTIAAARAAIAKATGQ